MVIHPVVTEILQFGPLPILANPPDFPGKFPFFIVLSLFPPGVTVLPSFSRFMTNVHNIFIAQFI